MIEYVKPLRYHPGRESIYVIVWIVVGTFIILNPYFVSKYTMVNALSDWEDYEANSTVKLYGTNITDVDDNLIHGITVTNTSVVVDINQTTLGDVGNLVNLTDFQFAGLRAVNFYQGGFEDLRYNQIYNFSNTRYINSYLPFLPGIPMVSMGYETIDITAIIQTILDISSFLHAPSWFDDVWNNVQIVVYWGSGDNAYGYSLGRNQSISESDYYNYDIDGVSVKTYALNISGELRRVRISGEYYNSTYIPGLKPISDYTYFDPSQAMWEFMGLKSIYGVELYDYFLSFVSGFDRVLFSIQQIPGYYKHGMIGAKYCGIDIQVKQDFNITKYFTPELNVHIGILDQSLDPVNGFIFHELNPFLGIHFNAKETVNNLITIDVTVVIIVVIVLIVVRSYSFEDQRKFEYVRDRYMS